jgi:hypothetical protein
MAMLGPNSAILFIIFMTRISLPGITWAKEKTLLIQNNTN